MSVAVPLSGDLFTGDSLLIALARFRVAVLVTVARRERRAFGEPCSNQDGAAGAVSGTGGCSFRRMRGLVVGTT